MAINAEAIKLVIENELASISDARVVAHIRGMLVELYIEPNDWDSGDAGQQYWMVLKDPNSVVEIVYCERPDFPWGLVGAYRGARRSHDWFGTFLEAFFESLASVELQIWRVYRVEPDKGRTPITDPGEWDATWARIYELRSSDPANRYECDHDYRWSRSARIA